ncbi:MAG: hypothetical protein BWY96_02914 [Spirochaetes bacterium ADurb.BinA120]|nr:MAG: hypothetical protein BWY96_02914 [Spirochaetes bacterium ADurb.BinA120]
MDKDGRRQPVQRFPRFPGSYPAYVREARVDHQHLFARGEGSPCFQQRIRRGQGRRHHAHQNHGQGARGGEHPRERDMPGADYDRPGEMAFRPRGAVFQHDDRGAGEGDVQDHTARLYRRDSRRRKPRGVSRVGGVALHHRPGTGHGSRRTTKSRENTQWKR